MTTKESNNEIDINEITCPITLDIFYDPVRINDGYVYERKAILNWFLSNGTSPITREAIKLKELRRDHRLKELAARHRASMASVNVPLDRLILPAAPVTPAIITKTKSARWTVVSIRNQQRKTMFRVIRVLITIIVVIALIVLPNIIVPIYLRH